MRLKNISMEHISVKEDTYYSARATATNTRNSFPYKVGDPVKLFASEIRGMTDGGYPGWSSWGGMTFKTPSDAIEYELPLVRYGSDFEDVRAIKVVKVYKKYITITVEEEVT